MTPTIVDSELAIPALPTPTEAYAAHVTRERLLTRGLPRTQSAAIPIPVPPILLTQGARVLIWKQDPTVAEIGIRKVFLPARVFSGPRDARILIQGMPAVTPNIFGDLVVDPIAAPDAFDAVHTYAIVRMVLTMYQRFRAPTPVPWQWNSGSNVDPLSVFPHAGVTQNAFYSRSQKALKFFLFDTTSPPPTHTVFTCRSFDIVAHETGHAILDGLRPNWLNAGNPPQTGGLHESFGDLTAIFLTLSQHDQCEAIVAQSKANLHQKNFLSDLAEQFGLALGRPNGLRNADNDLKLSQVGTEVHSLSQVFTGGVYDVLADIFAFERKPQVRDDTTTLYECGQYMTGLVFRALATAPALGATFADVVNRMLAIVVADGKPAQYRSFIVNRFALREVVSPAAVELAAHEAMEVAPGIVDDPEALQDRRGCCGTMQHEEYIGGPDALSRQLDELKDAFAELAGAEDGDGSVQQSPRVKDRP